MYSIVSEAPLVASVGAWTKLSFDIESTVDSYANQSCVFYNPQSNLYIGSNLNYIHGTLFSCYAPALPSAGNWTLYILGSYARYNTSLHTPVCSFNRPESFIAQTNLEVLAKAPKMTNALFSDTGANVLIHFDKAIQVKGLTAATTVPCSRVFNTTVQPGPWKSKKSNSNTRVYGNFAQYDSDCSISLQGVDTLVITMTNDFVTTASLPLGTGQFLLLRNNAVYEAGGFSAPASGFIMVAEPKVIPNPIGDILAASVLPLCANYEMDFTHISGSAGRNWKHVNISINHATDTYGGNINVSSISEYISSYTARLERGLGSISLDIVPGTYKFRIVFQNFLGGIKYWTLTVTKYSTNDVPFIILYSDFGSVDVDNSQLVTLYAASCK